MQEHIIISGASGALGKEVTAKFLSLSYHVHATQEKGKKSEWLASQKSVAVTEINLTDEKESKEFVEKCFRQIGRKEIVKGAVLTVGGFVMGDIITTSSYDVDQMISLNFKTAYHLARPLTQYLSRQEEGGLIVLVGARPAIEPDSGKDTLAYALSKSLLFQLAAIINAGTKESGVRSAVVVPSIIDTPVNRKAMPDADFSAWVPPVHIAEAISALFSKHAVSYRESVIKLYGNV